MAGLAGRAPADALTRNVDAIGIAGVWRIAASGYGVLVGAMAGRAREIESIGIHVHINENIRFDQ